jgi:imidazolonepropionase-like amidohydrolase
MMLDGWTWEDMTLKADAGMHVNWPRINPGSREGRENASELKSLEELFAHAQRYQSAAEAEDVRFDARLAAMGPVLRKEMPLIATAYSAPQIRSAVAFAKQWDVRLIVYGGYDVEECAELLVAENIPVIVGGVYRLPPSSRRDAAYDDAYTLPARLAAAGVQFAIASAGRFGASNIRNLPYNAATAAAFGLDPAAAVRAMTLSPAEIFGVADRVGAIAPDMDATLIITDGDILETPTQITAAFIQGRKVDLTNRHTQLYRKYSAKYEQLEDR